MTYAPVEKKISKLANSEYVKSARYVNGEALHFTNKYIGDHCCPVNFK